MNEIKLFGQVKKQFFKSEVVTKIIKNAGWLVGDKIFTMIIGVFVTATIARYFGPEIFGQYNYALSFVALFTAFSTLGLETLTVKSILDKDYDEGTVLCTSLVLRVVGGIFLTVMSSFIIRIIEPNDRELHILVLIMSFAMVIKALEVIEYWIQAYQKAKISSIIRMGAYVITAGLKLALVFFNGNLIHYATIYMFDALIIGIGLIIAYSRNIENKYKWKFDLVYARKILSQSWYLILSGLMVTIYMKIDQVMLGAMMPTKVEVGVYSAAVQVASMWYFVPMAIIVSFKPVIMKKKKTDEKKYIYTVQVLYTIVTWLSIAFGLFILIFSGFIIDLLYGSDFSKAASILSISIWAGTFAMIGTASSTWLVCEGLHKYNTIFVFSGAISNVLLNILLIPYLGGYGAAIATLVSQFIANVITPTFFKEVRVNSIMIFRAFSLFILRKGQNKYST
ncbi:flippase [Alkalibacterium sp. f15]|uniref:flippase n=1 Tax=Alkalibacterium sp. f15 TaxID=3414029 RepID=UPI003BF8A49A